MCTASCPSGGEKFAREVRIPEREVTVIISEFNATLEGIDSREVGSNREFVNKRGVVALHI
jgi:hypothetical protein